MLIFNVHCPFVIFPSHFKKDYVVSQAYHIDIFFMKDLTHAPTPLNNLIICCDSTHGRPIK